MELSGYLALVRRWWWTLLVAAWVAGLSGYLAGSQITPTYEARAQLLVGPINTDVDTLRASGQLVQTYAKLVTSQPILESTIQELGLPYTPGELSASVRATADDVTRFLTIVVADKDPEVAAKIANMLADEIIQLASRGSTRPEGELQIVDRADPPSSPIAPQVSFIVLLAAVAGLIGAAIVVLLIEYLGETVRTADDLARLTGFPFISAVGGARGGITSVRLLAVEAQPDSPAAVSYRQIATKVELANSERQLGSLVVLAAQLADGAGEAAANLAAALARVGRRVVLLDADPVAREVTTLFGLEQTAGLDDWLAEGRPGGKPVRHTHRPGFEVVAAGVATAVDAIDAERATALLTQLRTSFDVVVIAAGPVQEAAASLVWARIAEATILFAQRDHARRDDVAFEADSLRLVGATVAGAVLAEPQRRTPWRPSSLRSRQAPARSAATPLPPVPTNAGRSVPAQATPPGPKQAASPATGRRSASAAAGQAAGSASAPHATTRRAQAHRVDEPARPGSRAGGAQARPSARSRQAGPATRQS